MELRDSETDTMETSHETNLVTLPPIKKHVKQESLKKLLKRAVLDFHSRNPIVALYSLVEKESFRLDIVEFDKQYKGILYIDGRKFESLLCIHKKKARDVVVIQVLEYLFADVLQELREMQNSLQSTAIPNNLITFASFINTTLPTKTKLNDSYLNNQNDVCTKKMKLEFPQKMYDVPCMKENINPNTVKRLVQTALGLCESTNPNTITALFSLFKQDSFHFDVGTVKESGEFSASLHIGNKVYYDMGSSIKKAKNNVTKKALRDLFPTIASSSIANEVKQVSSKSSAAYDLSSIKRENNDVISEYTGKMSKELKSSNFPDFIANIVQLKYEAVTQSLPEHLRRYSVLSGIVMVQNDLNTATVICVSTGNKCLIGDQVTTNGDVLFDCHAEILSKRCLTSYLYTQLYLLLTTNSETILEVVSKDQYRVKSTVKFYLYISSAPCGDGRVFNFSFTKNPEKKKLAVKRGILRVKLESGMGGIPVTEYSELVPTYEDYLKGRPLVLMCCSAKLMRSNLLGVQGGLLSHFIEPVYFEGILIGNIFHKGHVIRALYDRLSNLSPDLIPPPYRINKPFIEGITDSKIIINTKPGKSCVNWVISDPMVESICTKTGKTTGGESSRLCKMNLFKKFVDILHLIKNIELSQVTTISYKEYKESSTKYQEMKKLFFDALENNGRGKWIKKPKELNQFFLNQSKRIKTEVAEVSGTSA